MPPPPFDVPEADFVIVGAGSAGSVLADRLSQDGRFAVAVIEAGPLDTNPFIHLPAGFLQLIEDPKVNWRMRSLPVPSLGGRRMDYPQGKVAGGTGSLNGMLYVRSNRPEHALWVAQGCNGWSYEETLPFYEAAEGTGAEKLPSIPVNPQLEVHELTRCFLAAAQSLGIPRLDSLNAGRREGAALFHQTRQGRFRAGPGQTYLRRARRRSNVMVHLNALARRILIAEGAAVGVEFSQNGETHRIKARREVIVSNGTLRSPQLLQASGIGPGAHLTALGIPVVADRPAVGDNLRDHFYVRMASHLSGVVTLNERTRGLPLARELARYVFAGGGLLTMGASSAAIFARSRADLTEPDLQLSFAAGSFQPGTYRLERTPGMTIAMYASYPQSTGTVRVTGAGTQAQPDIQPNYLSDPSDEAATLAGLRLMRRVLTAAPFAPFSPREVRPGPQMEQDEDLLAYARAQGVPGYHMVGTCQMGGDAASVVTPRLKVRGVERLRVIDASVLPSCTSGNSNAPTIMVAEKGAAMVLADAR